MAGWIASSNNALGTGVLACWLEVAQSRQAQAQGMPVWIAEAP